jgi:hypothetical protein
MRSPQHSFHHPHPPHSHLHQGGGGGGAPTREGGGGREPRDIYTPPIYPKAQTRFNPVRRSVADGVCGLVSMGSKSMALQTVCVEHSGRVRRLRIAQKSISAVGVGPFVGAKLVPPLGALCLLCLPCLPALICKGRRGGRGRRGAEGGGVGARWRAGAGARLRCHALPALPLLLATPAQVPYEAPPDTHRRDGFRRPAIPRLLTRPLCSTHTVCRAIDFDPIETNPQTPSATDLLTGLKRVWAFGYIGGVCVYNTRSFICLICRSCA